jgi:hypothetical protein
MVLLLRFLAQLDRKVTQDHEVIQVQRAQRDLRVLKVFKVFKV